MTVQILIDAVVRQTTVLIAQLATTGGLRAPLAHVANQVFLDLATELERQGVSRKVSADMFGLALRGYQRRLHRLNESASERGRSLWEAVLGYVTQAGMRTREQVLQRFARDDEMQLRSVLHDLTESGLLFCAGSGSAIYRAATPDELGEMRDLTSTEGLDELAWVIVFRDGPMTHLVLSSRLGRHATQLDALVDRLCSSGRLRAREVDGEAVYESAGFYIPLDNGAGWAAAVLDHFEAVVTTLCSKLQHSEGRADPHTGGSTYTFVLWPGHPLEREVLQRLQLFREQSSALRARVDEYNAKHGIPAQYQDVVSYAGQCVLDRESEERVDEQG